jgi:hypothetical protein
LVILKRSSRNLVPDVHNGVIRPHVYHAIIPEPRKYFIGGTIQQASSRTVLQGIDSLHRFLDRIVDSWNVSLLLRPANFFEGWIYNANEAILHTVQRQQANRAHVPLNNDTDEDSDDDDSIYGVSIQNIADDNIEIMGNYDEVDDEHSEGQDLQDDDSTNFLDPPEAQQDRTSSEDNRNGTLISRTNAQNFDIVRDTTLRNETHSGRAESEPHSAIEELEESSDSEESVPVQTRNTQTRNKRKNRKKSPTHSQIRQKRRARTRDEGPAAQRTNTTTETETPRGRQRTTEIETRRGRQRIVPPTHDKRRSYSLRSKHRRKRQSSRHPN